MLVDDDDVVVESLWKICGCGGENRQIWEKKERENSSVLSTDVAVVGAPSRQFCMR